MVFGEHWWLVYVLFLAIPLARILPRIIARSRNREGDYDYGAAHQDAARGAGSGTPRGGGRLAGTGRDATADTAVGSNDARRAARPDDRSGASAGKAASAAGAGGQTNEMVVMGAIHRGAKTFEDIQKKTGMDGAVLDRTLANLESEQMIRVVTRKGLLGVKVELYPTDKGFGRYYGR